MAITAYEFIQTGGLDRLNELVADKVTSGYEPFGPVVEFANGNFGQAVVINDAAAPSGDVLTAQPDIADITGAPAESDFNGLLAALRAAGVLTAA